MKNPFRAMLSRASASSSMEETKSAPLVALQLTGQASWTPRHISALTREGFQRNPIAYRCIRLIAESAASVPLCAKDCDDAAVHDLIHQSHTAESITDILERFYGHLQLSGNAYLEAGLIDGLPRGLFVLPPQEVSCENGTYVHASGSKQRVLRRNPVTGQTPLFHMKLLNPASDSEGYAPLSAAAQAVDIHNEGSLWTKALLDNSARPSGALVLSQKDGTTHLTQDQFDRLKDELEGAYAGASHAGRPMVLEGGLDWKPMSFSPADMDFMEARREAAREIALAFGVPPMLLGIPGDNTYANYREANQAFWRQSIIPLVNKTARGMTHWLRAYFGEDLTIQPDLDQVPALSEERSALWTRLSSADFLSPDEKRQLAGIGGRHAD